MKLDRNINADGRGKYGLILNREVARLDQRFDGGDGDVADLCAIREAIALLERVGIIDWGTAVDSEFMVIRLKDKYAAWALASYAAGAASDDSEYAREIWEMSQRAGPHHPNCKKPD